MGQSAGYSIRLSPLRRSMVDWLNAARRVPLVAIERTMPIADVMQARRAAVPKPCWFSIFLKAYSIVSASQPELRQSYLSLPRPRLFQHSTNRAAITIAREVNGEQAVLGTLIHQPEKYPLVQLSERIHAARTVPLNTVREYRRQILLARMPFPIRWLAWRLGLNFSGQIRARKFGTFCITGVAALGSASLHLLSPLTTTITYGVFRDDGTVTVRLFYDHRVLDGVGPARALESTEKTLNGVILDELKSLSRAEIRKAA